VGFEDAYRLMCFKVFRIITCANVVCLSNLYVFIASGLQVWFVWGVLVF
jgi:hypothetical protein